MYICIYIYVYIYIIFMYVCIYIYVCIYVYVCTHYTYTHTYIYIYICAYIYIWTPEHWPSDEVLKKHSWVHWVNDKVMHLSISFICVAWWPCVTLLILLRDKSQLSDPVHWVNDKGTYTYQIHVCDIVDPVHSAATCTYIHTRWLMHITLMCVT